MNHFPPGDWIDLARGALTPINRGRLESHVAHGCEECREASELWRQVARLSITEEKNEPPAAAVRIVKAAYRSAKPERWLPQVAQFARLVFDSFRQPDAATVRATMQASRQIVHESEPFTIDLWLESDTLRKRTFLTGQVLDAENPKQPATVIDVILLSGEHLVTRTTATTDGEFEMEFAAAENLQLFINIRGQRAIGMVLPDDA